MTVKKINNDDLLSSIIKGIEEVKGENINILDLRNIDNTPCDYFVVCEGKSNTQVSSIASSIQKNIVVHVFQKNIREFYRIENLWGDAKKTVIQSQY